MFGIDEWLAFEGADIAFIVVVAALYVVSAYIGRTFHKKL